MKKIYFILLSLIGSYGCFAQIVVASSPNMQAVTSVLQGNNLIVSNMTYRGSSDAMGIINATNSNLGIGNGFAISTGQVSEMAHSNDNTGTSTNWDDIGDSDLAAINGYTFADSHDAFTLEFDAVPAYSNINFQFVFASEDYGDVLSPAYQDVCGVFISGPGITGKKNLAVLPGITTPVNAASVNATTNAAFYIDNTNGTTVQYDGFTTLLTSSIAVVPLSTYHIKIGIADMGDYIYDSGLMIGGLGFWSALPSGIPEIGNKGVSVFPNPVVQTAVVNLPVSGDNQYLFRLFNSQGELMQSQTIHASSFVFDRNGLPSGIYFSEISGNKSTYRNKLILN